MRPRLSLGTAKSIFWKLQTALNIWAAEYSLF